MRPENRHRRVRDSRRRGGRARRHRRAPGPRRASPGPAPATRARLIPGDLLVSTSYYANDPDIVAGQTVLPPGSGSAGAIAIAGGDYPYVFNNDTVDASFGVTSRLFLKRDHAVGPAAGHHPGAEQRPGHQLLLEVRGRAQPVVRRQVPSRSSTTWPRRTRLTSPTRTRLASSTRPTRSAPPTTGPWPRCRRTASGPSPRPTPTAATTAARRSRPRSTASTTSTPRATRATGPTRSPTGVVLGAGTQIITPSSLPEAAQTPGAPTPVGSFNVTQLGDKADKVGKDDNFRGLTLYNDVLYYTKGSGGNGVNTIYFLDTTGTACPSGSRTAGRRRAAADLGHRVHADLDRARQQHVRAQGLPDRARQVGDRRLRLSVRHLVRQPDHAVRGRRGRGDNAYSSASGSYTAAAASTTAGLQKWVYNATAGQWQLAYTLQNGLSLGTPYTVPGYPTGINSVTSLPWSPATGGLRNITGRVNPMAPSRSTGSPRP